MKNTHTDEQLHEVIEHIKQCGAKHHLVVGDEATTISVLGSTNELDTKEFEVIAGVEHVQRISKPHKLASLHSKKKHSKVSLDGLKIGGNSFVAMAGPCSIENEERTLNIAHHVKKSGATIFRGGAFKPRSSPYSFQGLGEEGLKYMQKAKDETGLLIVSEAMDLHGLELCMKYVDIVQIGARNMQNYSLLKELGKINKPVMLKRGMSATIEEWLMSAEYILSGGNEKVILCERGIRSFDNQYSRNILDLNVIPILRELTHLPIIIDPSHGTGHRHMVSPMAKASLAAGADGIIVEVHDKPAEAMSDGPQALLPDDFSELMSDLKKIGEVINRKVTVERDNKGDAA